MKSLTKTGRIVFSFPFLVFGINHFFQAPQMAGMVPSFVPGGVLWVYLTGIPLVVCSVLIIINKNTKLAAYILATLLAIFVVTIHVPGLADESSMQMSFGNLLKDLGLLGGALVIAGISKV